MFQEFLDEYEPHPDILDRVAISGPRVETWNWRLTVLVIVLFGMAACFLFFAYQGLTSNAIRNTVQVWLTWVCVAVGVTALGSAFLLRRRSRLGWVSTTVLVTFLTVLYAVLLGLLLLRVYYGLFSVGELFPELLVEMGLFPFNLFLLYLINHKAVRMIFGVPNPWLRICLTVGGVLGAVAGGWLISLF